MPDLPTGAHVIDGRAVARALREGLAPYVAALGKTGVVPALHVVQVGNDPASAVYVRNKVRAAEQAGIRCEVHRLDAGVAQAALIARIGALGDDSGVSGLIVQLPLPDRLDKARCRDAVPPEKDVDGFHAVNLGHLLGGHAAAFVPCTPAGVMRLLAAAPVPVEGRTAVVVGRGHVGLPLAVMLARAGATVTVCHSRTRDLGAVAAGADILVAAAGKPALIGPGMVRPGAAVVDVGIHRQPDGTLAGDVDFPRVREVAGWITPVPGGVGPMTVAVLLLHTVRAACRRAGIPGP